MADLVGGETAALLEQMWKRLDQQIDARITQILKSEFGQNLVAGTINGTIIRGTVPPASLPLATTSTLGVVEVGSGLTVTPGGVLSTVGGVPFSWNTKTANYTIAGSDSGIAVDATSGNVTITLPTAVGASQAYAICRVDSSGHTVSVAAASGQLINGDPSIALVVAGQAVIIGSDGSNWHVEGSYYPSPLTTEGDIPYLHNGVLARLLAGANITITGGMISATASGVWGPISNGSTSPLILNSSDQIILSRRG